MEAEHAFAVLVRFQRLSEGGKRVLIDMFGNPDFQCHSDRPFARVAASLVWGMGVALGQGRGL